MEHVFGMVWEAGRPKSCSGSKTKITVALLFSVTMTMLSKQNRCLQLLNFLDIFHQKSCLNYCAYPKWMCTNVLGVCCWNRSPKFHCSMYNYNKGIHSCCPGFFSRCPALAHLIQLIISLYRSLVMTAIKAGVSEQGRMDKMVDRVPPGPGLGNTDQ